jgi:hypothetical protein
MGRSSACRRRQAASLQDSLLGALPTGSESAIAKVGMKIQGCGEKFILQSTCSNVSGYPSLLMALGGGHG